MTDPRPDLLRVQQADRPDRTALVVERGPGDRLAVRVFGMFSVDVFWADLAAAVLLMEPPEDQNGPTIPLEELGRRLEGTP